MVAGEPAGENVERLAAPRDQAVSRLTGVLTLAGVMNGVVLTRLLDLQPAAGAAMTAAMGAGFVILGEGLPFLRERARRRFAPSLERIAVKCLALAAIFALLAAAFLASPALARTMEPLVTAATPFWPALLALGVVVVALTDAVDPDPEDACHAFGSALLGRPADRAKVLLFIRGWLVKAFFLPLMFGILIGYFAWLREQPPSLSALSVGGAWVEWPVKFLYMIDVSIAVVGYSATLRLFGWHIRDAERTAAGWLVCLVCYPPLNVAVLDPYLPYSGGAVWSDIVDPHGPFGILLGVVILVLQFVYVGATIQFGPRFSNLTHRGLLTGGFYGLSRHPAYISKNLMWWLMSMPFVPGPGGVAEAVRRTVCLAGISTIYFLRARAEERMLSADPDYVAYKAAMERNSLVARVRTRLLRR